jgi:hypothetical protein
MHKNKKIIICKFNLKNKCLFGEKCKFQHLSMNELSDFLSKLEDLKQENDILKSELKEKRLEIRNLEKKYSDVTNDSVHVLAKPLYNSFFKKKHHNGSAKTEISKLKGTKIKFSTEDSGIDDETDTNDNVLSMNKNKPKLNRSFQNLTSPQNKQIELESKLNQSEVSLYSSTEKMLISSNLNYNLKSVENADSVGVMKPLPNFSHEFEALKRHVTYTASNKKSIKPTRIGNSNTIKRLEKENKVLKQNYDQLRSDFEAEKSVNNQILQHTCDSIEEIKLRQSKMELSLENLFNESQANRSHRETHNEYIVYYLNSLAKKLVESFGKSIDMSKIKTIKEIESRNNADKQNQMENTNQRPSSLTNLK